MSCGRQPIERREARPQRSRRWHPPHTRVVLSEMRRRVPYLIGTSFVTLLGALGAQQVPSFKSGVEIVLIDVTVVDPTGRPVTDLRPEDFRITVDRKPRTIASATFIRHDTRASVTALPEASRATPTGSPRRGSVPAAMTRDVLIVIDTDSMEPGDGLLVRRAVKGFLDQLAPDDRGGRCDGAVAEERGGAVAPAVRRPQTAGFRDHRQRAVSVGRIQDWRVGSGTRRCCAKTLKSCNG